MMDTPYFDVMPALGTVLMGKYLEKWSKRRSLDLSVLRPHENGDALERAKIVANRYLRRYYFDLYVRYGIESRIVPTNPNLLSVKYPVTSDGG
jgi:hypothetical protein